MKILSQLKSVIILSFILVGFGYSTDYDIIVNPGNSASKISSAELKRIYNGKMKSWNGSKVIPINQLYTSPLASKFIQDATGMDIEKYKSYWVEQQIKGKGMQPMLQKSDAAVKAIVATIPGAIGYISKGSADGSVKVISK